MMMVCGAGDFFVTTHLVPMVTDHGLSQTTAANMLAWLGLMSLIGVMVTGPLSDWMGNRILIMATFTLRILLCILILNVQGEIAYYIFALGFGFTLMITAVLTVTLIGKIYGFTHIGTLTGVINTMHHLSGGLLVYAGGIVFDSTSSYRLVFMIYCVLALASIIACGFIKEERLS